MTALRIGILVDDLLKRQYLSKSIEDAGHSLVRAALLRETEPLEGVAADAWIVDVAVPAEEESEGSNRQLAVLEALLESVTVPLIVSDSGDCVPGSDEHNAWLKRTMARLRQLAGDINLQSLTKAEHLWVLAASTGGPAAVREFISNLPPDLGLAFVYVQHIDNHYGATLVKMMNASPYPASLAVQGAVLQENRMLIVTARERMEVLANGTLALNEAPWGGPYAPSADQFAANVAWVYGPRAGLIVFSGMGDDGASACRLIKQRGGQVWAQSPASCASSSMPDSALATGCVDFTGTPEQLAHHLAEHCQQLSTLTRLKGSLTS